MSARFRGTAAAVLGFVCPFASAMAAGPSYPAAGPPVHFLTASPTNDLRTGLGRSGITVDTATHFGHVDATLSHQFGRSSSDARRMKYTTVSARGTRPFDTSSSTTSFVTDEGVANAVTLELAVAQLVVPIDAHQVDPDAMDRFLSAAKEKCLAAQRGVPDKCINSANLLPWLDRRAVDDLATKAGWTTLFGASATLGYKKYDVQDPLTLAAGRMNRVPFAISVQGGGTFSGNGFPNGWFFGVVAQYREEYAAAPKEIRCESGGTQCIDAAFLAPSLRKSADLVLVARRQTVFPLGLDLPIGWQLKAGHDFVRGIWGGEAATYIALDSSGKFAAGLKFKLETGDGDPITKDMRHKLSLFLGTSF